MVHLNLDVTDILQRRSDRNQAGNRCLFDDCSFLQDEIIGRNLLPEGIVSPSSRFASLSSFPLSKDISLFEVTDAFERRVIIEMLEQTGWSQTEAADNFRIPLSTLNQKIKRHGIEIKKKRDRVNV